MEDLEADGKIILTRITEKQNGMAGTGLFRVRIGTRGEGGCCEYNNEPSNSTKCRELLD